MSSFLQIRNVPAEMHRAVKARAAARGMSLNAYLLEVVGRDVTRPTVAEVLQRAASRAEHADASAVDVVRTARTGRAAQMRRRTGA